MDLLSLSHYQQLQENLDNLFLELKNNVLKSLKNGNLAQFLGNIAPKLLKNESIFIAPNSVQFYFLSEVQSFITLAELYLEQDEENYEIIFEELSQTSLAPVFEKNINEFKEVEGIKKTLLLYQEQLISFFHNHILKDQVKFYYFYEELGDYYNTSKELKILHAKDNTLNFKGASIEILANTKTWTDVNSRIESALEVISECSPESFTRFKSFTKAIIPSSREEIVSYSIQYLPGYSVINMLHRDRLDLIDDLLHENGHHHLNLYLLQDDLFEEVPDEIFYSPWRNAPRPLRGIYHGTFTFYFAQQIYLDLAIYHLSNPEMFTKEEGQKIYDRLIEETLMLETTFKDLAWAYEQGWIYESGYELIKVIINKIIENKQSFKDLDPAQLALANENKNTLKLLLNKQSDFYNKER